MPSTNRVVQIAAHTTTDAAGDTTATSGVMDFMLMDNDVSSATNYFANLVSSGFYKQRPNDSKAPDGKQIIFRDDSDVLQMGSTNNTNSGGGAATSVDDDYNPNLVYTSNDILAMANSGDNTNNSQFFITNKVERGWDFRYTILGVMTEGNAFRQSLSTLPRTTNTTTGLLEPNDPVVIDSVSLITDTTDGILELSAPTTSAGNSYTVNIVVSDGNSADDVTVPLTVNVISDPPPPPPYLLQPISEINVVSGQSASLNVQANVPSGATANYTCTGSSGLTVSNFSATTGQGTLTASSSFAGQGYVTEEVNWPGRRDKHVRRHPGSSGVGNAHRAERHHPGRAFGRDDEHHQLPQRHPLHDHRRDPRDDGDAVCGRETWLAAESPAARPC